MWHAIRRYNDPAKNDDRFKSVAETEQHAWLSVMLGWAGAAILVAVTVFFISAVLVLLSW
jgi:hypothetical protein|tara:strand:- start:4889 stop:5068 length:180 start_codon:yes stop_codon:yes gene_type:complete